MSEFTSESAILHLKEHWNDITNPIAFSGVTKLYDFYEGKLSKSQIKNELAKAHPLFFLGPSLQQQDLGRGRRLHLCIVQ